MLSGRHILFDGSVPIRDWRVVEVYPGLGQMLREAARTAGATPLDGRVILLPDSELSRPDSPPGGTAWIGLDESHVTLHWYVSELTVHFAIDAFTCGDRANPAKLVDLVLAMLHCNAGHGMELHRFNDGGIRVVKEWSAQG